ncbi:MAG: ABC transporter ATP-binding protein [Spirochaetaceae bacterium]
MPSLTATGLSKSFETVAALQNVTLDIDDQEFLVVLGPSGCGKTTLLRCLAGLEYPDSGEIHIGDTCVFSARSGIALSPRERSIGMVFQNYALYPHMSVRENVAFGLRMRKTSKNEMWDRVGKALRMVDLEGFENRSPKTLSGGQRQRVALARTLVTEPAILLFDEPLSNLDPKLRVGLRAQLKRIHREIGATSVFVTHDQSEAMVLGDRIAVIQNGILAQIDEPQRLYHCPVNIDVALFTGNPHTNAISGEVHRTPEQVLLIPEADPYCFLGLPDDFAPYAGDSVTLTCRPEDVDLIADPAEDEGTLEVITSIPDGSRAYVHLKLGNDPRQLVVVAPQNQLSRLTRNTRVGVRINRGNLYERATGLHSASFGVPRLPQRRRASVTD